VVRLPGVKFRNLQIGFIDGRRLINGRRPSDTIINVKLNNLGRLGLLVTLVTLSALRLSAQSGGFSYLEFVENKGQWDSSVRFQSKMSAGRIYMHRKGFTVLMEDTSDLKRIGELLHGDYAMAAGKSPKSSSSGGVTGGIKGSGTAPLTQATAIAGSPSAGLQPGTGGGGSSGGSGSGQRRGEMLPSNWGTGTAADPMVLHSHSYRVSFVNANDNVSILPDKAVSSYNNYMVGDKKNWTTHCKIYQGLLYENLYNGIDIHYYTDIGTLKYDIVVHPGADPRQVILQYDGQTSLSIRKNKVYIQTTVGTVQELEPNAYQVNAAGRKAVACHYTLLSANRIGFTVDDYSPDATLVIDPTEIFCSFTGSASDNWGYSATYDNAGNLYMGGIVLDETNLRDANGNGFPASPGAFQTTFQGGELVSDGPYYQYDVGIMKLSANGADRVYATYLGGSGNEQPHSMVVDNSGDLIVMGRTTSTNFPVTTPLVGSGGGYDIFVTKFNPEGTGLIGSMRIGGKNDDGVNYRPKYADTGVHYLRLNYGDDGRGEIILDAAGNIYVASCTQSFNFPTTAGVFQPNPGTTDSTKGAPWLTQDGVLMKLTPNLTGVTFATYLGGSGIDVATVLALSPLDNSIWVGGGTASNNFPGTNAANVYVPGQIGGIDGFISIVSNDGKTLEKSSYFGTQSTDMIYGLDFDNLGYPYIMGTSSGVVPVFNSPFNAGGNQASGNQFITKLKQDLSGIVYSTNFGPGNVAYPNISPTAFLVDRCQNVYVSGWGGGPNNYENYTKDAGTSGLTTTSNALRTTTDGSDFYFFVLQKNAASQLYGSFFGQVNGAYGDHVDGGTSRFDAQGVIYEAICANCYGGAVFPTTLGAYATKNGTGTAGCNEAGVKIAFNFSGVYAGLKTVTHGRGDSVGCVPLTVSFQDTIRNATSYIWVFGDGTPPLATTNYAETHTYTALGTYQVMLIAIDPNTCNGADTVYRDIVVKSNPAALDFDFAKLPPCTSLNFIFTNLSTAPAAVPFTDSSFQWDFGDGSADITAGMAQITHPFPSAGSYNITLSLIDTNYCNYPLDTTRIVNVAPNVKAQFVTPAFGCAPDSAIFNNTTIGGENYYWYFGDGSPVDSTDISPIHFYPNPGTYTITLVAVDSNTCNIIDSTSFTITLQSKPTADFAYQPTPSESNTPTVFTPTTSPVVKYLWEFGDGTSETKTEPDTVVHLYVRTDTFNVCLIVTNVEGCTDTVCHPVQAVIHPLLDVPNAFTPGRFGQNAVIKVMGFGITNMTWRIYNRWGQLIFQSDNPYDGWDGTYRGVVQPMDVYAYTLEVEFSNGTRATKKGDITLIR
jgi:gliding motility-associated-like protein